MIQQHIHNILKLLDINQFSKDNHISEFNFNLYNKKHINIILYFLFWNIDAARLHKNLGLFHTLDNLNDKVHNQFYFQWLMQLKADNNWPNFVPVRTSYLSDNRSERFEWMMLALAYYALRNKLVLQMDKQLLLTEMDALNLKTKTIDNMDQFINLVKQHEKVMAEYKYKANLIETNFNESQQEKDKYERLLNVATTNSINYNIEKDLHQFEELYSNNQNNLQCVNSLLKENSNTIDSSQFNMSTTTPVDLNKFLNQSKSQLSYWMNEINRLDLNYDSNNLKESITKHQTQLNQLMDFKNKMEMKVQHENNLNEKIDRNYNDKINHLNQLFNQSIPIKPTIDLNLDELDNKLKASQHNESINKERWLCEALDQMK